MEASFHDDIRYAVNMWSAEISTFSNERPSELLFAEPALSVKKISEAAERLTSFGLVTFSGNFTYSFTAPLSLAPASAKEMLLMSDSPVAIALS